MGIHESQDLHGCIGKHPKKLIEAVVDCAYSDAKPPPELKIGWQCQRWRCLPDTGAYFDQGGRQMEFVRGWAGDRNPRSGVRLAVRVEL